MVTPFRALAALFLCGCIGGPPQNASDGGTTSTDQGTDLTIPTDAADPIDAASDLQTSDVTSDLSPVDASDAADTADSADAAADVRDTAVDAADAADAADMSKPRICCADNPPIYRVNYEPDTTYLQPLDDDLGVGDVPAVDLQNIGICPGDRVMFVVQGGLTYSEFDATETTNAAHAATFSSSDVLLDASNPDRVPDAVPTTDGNDVVTVGDVDHDFHIPASTTVTVPQDATHLFITVVDTVFSDNADEDDDLRIAIGCP